MNKVLKSMLILVGLVFGFIIIDTAQAMLFSKNPWIVLKQEKYTGNIILETDKGILVDTVHCANEEVHTYFKWNPYTCPVKEEDVPTN